MIIIIQLNLLKVCYSQGLKTQLCLQLVSLPPGIERLDFVLYSASFDYTVLLGFEEVFILILGLHCRG